MEENAEVSALAYILQIIISNFVHQVSQLFSKLTTNASNIHQKIINISLFFYNNNF